MPLVSPVVAPVYPPIAQSARIQGTVIIEAHTTGGVACDAVVASDSQRTFQKPLADCRIIVSSSALSASSLRTS